MPELEFNDVMELAGDMDVGERQDFLEANGIEIDPDTCPMCGSDLINDFCPVCRELVM